MYHLSNNFFLAIQFAFLQMKVRLCSCNPQLHHLMMFLFPKLKAILGPEALREILVGHGQMESPFVFVEEPGIYPTLTLRIIMNNLLRKRHVMSDAICN